MSVRVDWTNYEHWRKLWDGWVRAYGEDRVVMPRVHFLDLYNHFVRTVKEIRKLRPDFDVRTIDVEAFLDPKLTYQENKLLLDQILGSPPTEKDYKSMSDEFVSEAIKDVKAHYPEVVEHFEKRVKEAEKEAEKYPKVDRERKKFKKLTKDLAAELEVTKQDLEEAKKKPAELASFKIRILKPFSEGIMSYVKDQVIETRNVDWALDKIQMGYAERVGAEVPVRRPLPTLEPEVKKVEGVKVLPPTPEKCPLDGSGLEVMKKVPILVKDSPLTAQEEYLRARVGMPLPKAEVKWIDVPITMQIWGCKGTPQHYYERVNAKLVQRTSEYIYRKIIRETAKIRKITAPATPFPPELGPIYRKGYVWVPPKPSTAFKPPALPFMQWIELPPHNLTKWKFERLEEAEKKILREEYLRLCKEWLDRQRRGE